MTTVNDVRMWLKMTLCGLVDDVSEVEVELVEGQQAVIFEASVAPEDVRRVIGRKGQTADALRALLVGMSGKQGEGRRFQLEILEPQRGGFR